MKYFFILITIFITIPKASMSQATDHWETVIYADTVFRYTTSNEGDPGAGWREPGFDDSGWQSGHGGIGYGDGDDRTITDKCNALFYRVNFYIWDTSLITAASLDIDYDDAFVAYLNGVEIARSAGLTGSQNKPYPPYNGLSSANHEAHIPSEGKPEGFFIDKSLLNKALRERTNVLAIEVHNVTSSSSDMSSTTFFSIGLSVSGQYYLPTPSWFTEPFVYRGSTLPIISINTYGQSIPNEPKITAWMKIIDKGNGQMNEVSDSANVYDGYIGIEIRGASSAGYPQHPYSLETRDSLGENLNVPLLGMPAENDWVLLSHYNEKTFMRNPLSFHMFQEMGHYATRTRLVDVVINGKYEGIYLFGEKIKRDKNRINIKKLTPDDTSGIDVTGGYIFKTDYAHSYDSWLSAYSPIDHPDYTTRFVYYYPRYYNITEEQKAYLQEYVDQFQAILHQSDFAENYPGYIDLQSFLDYFIVSEVSRNIDGYKKSHFYYKDRYDKDNRLHQGPVWDFDWAWKNIHDCSFLANTNGSGWAYKTNDCRVTDTPGWYVRLLQDTTFANELNCRYFQLRQDILSLDHLYAFMDSIYHVVKEPQKNHYGRWPILGVRTGAPEFEDPATTYDQEVSRLKEWIRIRLEWLDANMPGNHDQCMTFRKDYKKDAPHLRIFPNPATESFYVEAEKIITGVTVYDISGRQILARRNLNSRSVRIDAALVETGIYLVRTEFSSGAVRTARLIIR